MTQDSGSQGSKSERNLNSVHCDKKKRGCGELGKLKGKGTRVNKRKRRGRRKAIKLRKI